MTDLAVKLTLPDTSDASHFVPLQIVLEAISRVNEYHCKRARRCGLPVPPLYTTGVRYIEEDGREEWLDLYGVLKQGGADCEDLAAWRVGELRAAGVKADPVLKWRWVTREQALAAGLPIKRDADGLWLVHCLVRFPDGTIEDPSKILGMGGGYTGTI
jgi:hypothetical protein